MSRKGPDVSTIEAVTSWVGWCLKVDADMLHQKFDNDQLVWLAERLAENQLLNPPKAGVKHGVFLCQCGCGQTFEADYTTRKPQYMNAAHKMRRWRRLQRVKVTSEGVVRQTKLVRK